MSYRNLIFIAVMTIMFLTPTSSMAQVYDFEVVAQTGVAVGTGTPIALGTGPSINGFGKVSFIARDTDATHGRVMTLNNGVIEKDCFVGTIASVADEVQINDNDQVIFRMNSDDGLFSDVVRLDGPCGGDIIGKGSFSTQFPEPFNEVLPRVTLNDTGRGLFSADIGVNTMLGSRLNGTGNYDISPVLSGFPNLYPMLSDNDKTAVRWGGTNTSPLYRFVDTNLNAANFIAESTDFNAIGQAPGISDDGNVVAFVGDSITEGFGIFVSLFNGTDFTPIKISGISGDGRLDPTETFLDTNKNGVFDVGEIDFGFLSNFSLTPRVGVNRSHAGVVGRSAIPAGNFSRRDKLKTFRKDFTLLSDASRRYEPKFATNLAGMAVGRYTLAYIGWSISGQMGI